MKTNSELETYARFLKPKDIEVTKNSPVSEEPEAKIAGQILQKVEPSLKRQKTKSK